MISSRPQTSKTGGLPNISFIKRKPKPLGTELKNGVDSDSGVMICAEIQEGNWAEGSSLANAPRARQVGHDGKAHRRVEKYALRISRMRIQRRARRRRAGVREAYTRRLMVNLTTVHNNSVNESIDDRYSELNKVKYIPLLLV